MLGWQPGGLDGFPASASSVGNMGAGVCGTFNLRVLSNPQRPVFVVVEPVAMHVHMPQLASGEGTMCEHRFSLLLVDP